LISQQAEQPAAANEPIGADAAGTIPISTNQLTQFIDNPNPGMLGRNVDAVRNTFLLKLNGLGLSGCDILCTSLTTPVPRYRVG
jgi:hypothetical protein